ncbi:hypothetical protein [Streptomyces sp. NPDC087307]|uniref:hypothetical protein n=1 Tax=Streptomyces sp. NPDC087307 TaxID=3365782 RepID=UPI00382AF9D4
MSTPLQTRQTTEPTEQELRDLAVEDLPPGIERTPEEGHGPDTPETRHEMILSCCGLGAQRYSG